ncbi:hypothetical protein QFZ75_004056 [Streptomyces sp. V3I8]|uniref:hypothetical protein n=1 Tax=Streptomyces sp. V3I8 TaxID=3042279 RepID=UPI0027812A63|nr:hypothetical protein [Streptomyces sp. V3I8]MDQ1037640.1 hypothetical protein [Streptomyces sp. V3I8]
MRRTETGGEAAFAALLESGEVREVHDRIDDRLEELVGCLRPGDPPDARDLAAVVTELRAGVEPGPPARRHHVRGPVPAVVRHGHSAGTGRPRHGRHTPAGLTAGPAAGRRAG